MRLCFICKSEIELERIESMPETRLCMKHGREIEKFGGEFKLSASQERISKQGSLKLNYGGITTHKVRNERALESLKDEFDLQNLDE